MRDKIFISNLLWCVIQIVVYVLGYVAVSAVSILAVISFNLSDFRIVGVCIIVYSLLFMKLKWWLEEEFADCIDAEG